MNDSTEERAWIDSQERKAEAEWLVAYARALNTLDVEPLHGTLSPWVSYESQAVFDKIVGRDQLLGYWRGKFTTLRRSDQRVRAALGTFPGGQPCAVLYQASGGHDTNWLDAPIAAMTVKTNALGEAESLLMVTSVPSPAEAECSGLFPGCADVPVPSPKRFLRSSSTFDEITLCVFYLDGHIGLDRAMAESVAHVKSELPGIQVIELKTSEAGIAPPWDLLERFRFMGFPSVGALFEDKPIYRHEGLIRGPDLAEALRKAAPLHVEK